MQKTRSRDLLFFERLVIASVLIVMTPNLQVVAIDCLGQVPGRRRYTDSQLQSQRLRVWPRLNEEQSQAGAVSRRP